MLPTILICWYAIGVCTELGAAQRSGKTATGADWFIILIFSAWFWPRLLLPRRKRWWEH